MIERCCKWSRGLFWYPGNWQPAVYGSQPCPLPTVVISVLRIRDVCTGSWLLSIPDPGSWIQQQQQKGGGDLLSYLFYSLNFYIIENYSISEQVKNHSTSLSSQKYGFGIRNRRSRVRKKTWSWILGSKRHQIPDPNPQRCLFVTDSRDYCVYLKLSANHFA